MPTVSPGTNFGIANIIVPKGGPKGVPALLDFSNTASWEIDGQQLIDSGQLEYVQGVFVDNADNAVALTLLIHGIEQRLVVPANSQGYFAIMATNPPKMTANMAQAANRKVSLIFYNVPIQSAMWKTV